MGAGRSEEGKPNAPSSVPGLPVGVWCVSNLRSVFDSLSVSRRHFLRRSPRLRLILFSSTHPRRADYSR
ncbi:unnamed protein product [Merluccius merluccius]